MDATFKPNAAIFFFVWVLVGGWVVMSLACVAQVGRHADFPPSQGLEVFTGVIIDGFQTMKENQAAKRVCSPEQDKWISTM